MKMQNRCFLALLVLFATVMLQKVRGDILTQWNLTFENPPHTNGDPVTLGQGTDRPTGSAGAGRCDVGFGLGNFTSQVAFLHNVGAMWLLPIQTYTSGIHRISWDLAGLSVDGNSFLQFSAGVHSENDPGGGPFVGVEYKYWIYEGFNNYSMHLYIEGQEAADLGQYVLGEQDHFETTIDLDGDWVSFSLNGSVIYSNYSVNLVRDIRSFNFGTGTLVDPTFAVDNVRWEIIPEPSTNILISLGGAGLALRHLHEKRRKQKD